MWLEIACFRTIWFFILVEFKEVFFYFWHLRGKNRMMYRTLLFSTHSSILICSMPLTWSIVWTNGKNTLLGKMKFQWNFSIRTIFFSCSKQIQNWILCHAIVWYVFFFKFFIIRTLFGERILINLLCFLSILAHMFFFLPFINCIEKCSRKWMLTLPRFFVFNKNQRNSFKLITN